MADFFLADWNPRDPSANMDLPEPWKAPDFKENHNTVPPEVCWDHSGQMLPLSLSDMTDEEKEVCGVITISFTYART